MTHSAVDSIKIIATADFRVTQSNEGNAISYRSNQYIVDKQNLGRGSLQTCMFGRVK
jgi:hypothetical protein